jgi:ferric iron reductase protein FhuF
MGALDMEVLNQYFFVTTKDQESNIFSMSIASLCGREEMEELLSLYTPILQAEDVKATACAIVRWLAGPAVAHQAYLSVMNQAIDMSPDNLYIQVYPANGTYRFSFKIQDWKVIDAPTDEIDRKTWFIKQVSSFYSESIRPLLENLAKTAQMNVGQLWGQLPRKFDIYIDLLKQKYTDSIIVNRLEKDYEILKLLPSQAFGRKRNPFHVKTYKVESIDDPNKFVPIECTCCLNYLIKGGEFCFTCPRLKNEEREEMRINYRKNLQNM